MKIAVTYENGEIFQHFGMTRIVKFYETDGRTIKSAAEVNIPEGVEHASIINFLQEQGAEVLICGGLGLRAQEFLTNAGIKVCGGASGNADAAVQAYLNDSLDYDPLAAEHHGPCGHCHEEE